MSESVKVIIDGKSVRGEFVISRSKVNEEICKYPEARLLDLIGFTIVKPSGNTPGTRARNLLKTVLTSKKEPLGLWMLKYKEFIKLFENAIFKKTTVFNTRIYKPEEVFKPTLTVKIRGYIRDIRLLIENEEIKFDESVKVLSSWVRYRNRVRFFLLNTHCDKNIFIPDLNRQVFLKPDMKTVNRFKRLAKIKNLDYNNITYELKVKDLVNLFKDKDIPLSVQTEEGSFVEFVDIIELLKDPDNKKIVKHIVDAHKNRKSTIKYENNIYIFDNQEVDKHWKQILIYLSDEDIQKIKSILEKANRIKKETDPEVMKKLKKLKVLGEPSPYQEVGISWLYNLYKEGIPGAILGDSMGLGKALAHGTLIRTPTSWVPIENLEIGDLVVTPSGKRTIVTGIFPQGVRKTYKVQFEDYREIIADSEHLWKIFVDNKEEVTTTEKILEYIRDGKSVFIPTVSNIEGYNSDEIDYYEFGKDIQKNIALLTIEEIDLKLTIYQKIMLLKGIFNLDRDIESLDGIYYLKNLKVAMLVQTLVWSLGGVCQLHYDTLTSVIQIDIDLTSKVIQISDVHEFAEVECTCISVKDKESLYVAENYIVTHNTFQSIMFLALANPKSVAVIAPASVTSVWKNEIKKFYPLLEKKVDIYSYESVARKGLPKSYDIIILDEGQKVKNPATLAATLLRNTQAKFKLILTGTPIENSIRDLFSLVLIIIPQAHRMLSILYNKIAGRDEMKATQLTKSLIKGIYLGRSMSKSVVQTNFTIINKIIELSKEEMEIYKYIKKVYTERLQQVTSETLYYNDAIVGLKRLLQAISNPQQLPQDLIPAGINVKSIVPTKLKNLKEIISQAKKEKNKVIVFAIFTETIELLKKSLNTHNNVLVLQGSTPKSERGALVHEFQANPSKDVFIISLQAGATGLTLTAANYVVMYDLWWNPAVEAQAFARAYRRGQTKDVYGYRLVAKDTIDEKILKSLNYKSLLLTTFKSSDSKKIARQLIDDVFKGS